MDCLRLGGKFRDQRGRRREERRWLVAAAPSPFCRRRTVKPRRESRRCAVEKRELAQKGRTREGGVVTQSHRRLCIAIAILPSMKLEPSLFVEIATVAIEAAAAAVTRDATEVPPTAVDADLSRGKEKERRERKGVIRVTTVEPY
ncbi:uncharacterized protein DS421_16g544090 [Arachis hypogaea]|nr:uncharacterized protein DS421_16g544090 [Arachis hypogaea]